MEVKQFRDDLHKMSLADALKKHNLTLKEAMESMPMPYNKDNKKTPTSYSVSKNITYKNGRFYLRKSIHNKTYSFGSYLDMDDAIKFRDYCEENDCWLDYSIDEICEKLGIDRLKKQKKG